MSCTGISFSWLLTKLPSGSSLVDILCMHSTEGGPARLGIHKAGGHCLWPPFKSNWTCCLMGGALSLKPVASSTFSGGSNPPRSALDGSLLKATWHNLLGRCSGNRDSSQKAGFKLLGITRLSMSMTQGAVHSKGRPLPKHQNSFGSTCTSSFFLRYHFSNGRKGRSEAAGPPRSPKFSAFLGGLRLKYLLLRPLPPHWLMVSSRNSAATQPGSMHDPMHDASEAWNDASSSYPLEQK